MYRELAPPPDLAAHVACVWTSVSRGGTIFPDGCVDIVWRGDRLVVAGPATGPVDSDVPVGVPVFGVRFRLGVAGAALGLPAGEFLDGNVPVSDLWGPAYDERVAAGGVARAGAGGARAAGRRAGRRLARAAALAMARPGARVDVLGAALGVSERQLRRRFVDAVGYGPKTLARVLRFQRFLALAGTGEELARLALLRGLRRSGASDARDAPAGGPHAARARDRARQPGGRRPGEPPLEPGVTRPCSRGRRLRRTVG